MDDSACHGKKEVAVRKGRVDDAEKRKNGGGVEPVVYDECGGGGPDHGRNNEAVTEEEEKSVVGLDGDAAQVRLPPSQHFRGGWATFNSRHGVLENHRSSRRKESPPSRLSTAEEGV